MDIGSVENNTVPEPKGLFIWKGFSHKWLRTVMGFKTPHRISKFSNYIFQDNEMASAESSEGKIHMAQNTGVDGDYMRPITFYQHKNTENINALKGKCKFIWTDNGDNTKKSILI